MNFYFSAYRYLLYNIAAVFRDGDSKILNCLKISHNPLSYLLPEYWHKHVSFCNSSLAKFPVEELVVVSWHCAVWRVPFITEAGAPDFAGQSHCCPLVEPLLRPWLLLLWPRSLVSEWAPCPQTAQTCAYVLGHLLSAWHCPWCPGLSLHRSTLQPGV